MSGTYPRLEAACLGVTAAMALIDAAKTKTKPERIYARFAERAAADEANAAYGEEL
jgi:hypothetical protein